MASHQKYTPLQDEGFLSDIPESDNSEHESMTVSFTIENYSTEEEAESKPKESAPGDEGMNIFEPNPKDEPPSGAKEGKCVEGAEALGDGDLVQAGSTKPSPAGKPSKGGFAKRMSSTMSKFFAPLTKKKEPKKKKSGYAEGKASEEARLNASSSSSYSELDFRFAGADHSSGGSSGGMSDVKSKEEKAPGSSPDESTE